MKKENMMIRKAERRDVPLLLEFIKGIARYEKMENEVVASPEVLEREMFDEHRAEAVFVVADGKIISFTHGMMSCNIGRQCPKCHSFVVEHNESKKYHEFGEAKEDFTCPKCSSVIRKKEESIFKGNDDPLVCPKCQSSRLEYQISYLT